MRLRSKLGFGDMSFAILRNSISYILSSYNTISVGTRETVKRDDGRCRGTDIFCGETAVLLGCVFLSC